MELKRFETREVREAIDYAETSKEGAALHMGGNAGERGPKCFHNKEFAHLISKHENRLKWMAQALGVNRIEIHRRGQRGQHVDLTGRPLQRALEEAAATQAAAGR